MTFQLNPYCGTTITAPPTFEGPAGKAWRLALSPVGRRSRPDWDATIALYLVRVPAVHAFWDHWFIGLIHLRQIEGVRPPAIHREGASHELMIIALDPEHPLPGLVVDAPDWTPRFLTPFDVQEQFTVANDAVADQLLWRGWWAAAIAQTAQHFNDGTHSLGRPQ